MTLKRSREEVAAEAEAMAMANCLVLLSHHRTSPDNNNKTASSLGWELFECKTCKKKFKSFQALGGHRASHKRPKPDPQDLKDKNNLKKKHECSVCGLEFGLGQALGGHMRKHRADQQQNTAKSADLLTAVVMKNNEEEEKKKVVLFGIDLLDFTTPLLEDDSRVDTRFVVDIPRTTLDLFV